MGDREGFGRIGVGGRAGPPAHGGSRWLSCGCGVWAWIGDWDGPERVEWLGDMRNTCCVTIPFSSMRLAKSDLLLLAIPMRYGGLADW